MQIELEGEVTVHIRLYSKVFGEISIIASYPGKLGT